MIVVFPDHTHLLSKLDLFPFWFYVNHCFGMYCFVSSVVSQPYKRELVALFYCLPGVLCLLMFCGSYTVAVGWTVVCDWGIS